MRLPALVLAFLLAGGPAPAQSSPQPNDFQNVTVKPGDTLWSIAKTYLKDPTRWNELLRYNTLPSSDPTVALPGMKLRVPRSMLRDDVAHLAYIINSVLYRPRDSAEWKQAKLQLLLMRDYGLRTLSSSKARLQFINGDLLSLDQNSMAILRPIRTNYDLELLGGSVYAGRARVVTASASIIPKTLDTHYSAKVREDLSTLVQVFAGMADVTGQGKTVTVKGGFGTEVALGRTPAPPAKLPKLDTPEAILAQGGFGPGGAEGGLGPGEGGGGAGGLRPGGGRRGNVSAADTSEAQAPDIGQFRFDLRILRVGIPVAAYHVQASRSRDFDRIAYERTFDSEEDVDLRRAELAPGQYWWRVAMVDLLGVESKWSEPKLYRFGAVQERVPVVSFTSIFELFRPPEGGETSKVPKYRVTGRAGDDLAITVNGTPLRAEGGNFATDISLERGPNRVRVSAADPRGNTRVFDRTVNYEP